MRFRPARLARASLATLGAAAMLAATLPLPAAAAALPPGAWVAQAVPAADQGYDLRGVFFASPTEGWAVGGTTQATGTPSANGVPASGASVTYSAGVVLQTTDGGQTWSPATGGGGLLWELYGISGSVVDGQPQLMAVGDGGERGTSAGGGSWTFSSTCGIECASDATTAVASATVGSAVYGMAVLADGSGQFSTDGGATWAAGDLGASGPLFGVTAQQVSGAVYGWAVGGNAAFFTSSDGGSSWLSGSVGGGADLYGVASVQGTGGQVNTYAVGGGASTPGTSGWIVLASGGGVRAQTVPAGTPDLFAVSFEATNPQVGWAVGAQGTILYTSDGGTTWTAMASGTTASLHGVFATTDGTHDHAWAVGAQGTVLALSEPASITINPAAAQVQASGTTSVTGAVYGTVYGTAAGFLLPGSPVTLSTGGPGQGGLAPGSTTTAGDGTDSGVTYTAPATAATATLTASTPGVSGSVTASATVVVTAPAPPPPTGSATAPPPPPPGGVQQVQPSCANPVVPLRDPALAADQAVILAGPVQAPAGAGDVSVTLTATRQPPAAGPGGNVLVYDWNAGLGAWIAVPTALDGQTATAAVPAASQAALLAYTLVNPPDTVGTWSDPYVLLLQSLGIVQGYGNCTFGPDAALTRNQLAKMLTLALHLPVPSAQPAARLLARYADAAAIPTWAAPYVAAVTQAGTMSAISGATFDGSGDVTRDQMAAVLGKVLGPEAPQAALSFVDDAAIEPWALPGMRAAIAAGLIDGYPGLLLKPLQTTTRGEVAKMLAMYLLLHS